MEQPPFKSELRLIIQASVPVEEIIEAEELYRQLKEILKNYSEKVSLNGQIMKMLEPCCKDRSVIAIAAKQSQKENGH